MRTKKYKKPFDHVVINLEVRYKMDCNLWGLHILPSDKRELDFGRFMAHKPSWYYRNCGYAESVWMVGSRIIRNGKAGARESSSTLKWSTEPIGISELARDEVRDSVMDDIESVLYRSVARITHSTFCSKRDDEVGTVLGAGELVRQRARVALVKFILDLKWHGVLSPDKIKREDGKVVLSKCLHIGDFDGNDSVEFVFGIEPHYDDAYIKSFSGRFRRRHEKAQYKRLARRYKELNAKYKDMETQLKFVRAQYESMRSRFMSCQKYLGAVQSDDDT